MYSYFRHGKWRLHKNISRNIQRKHFCWKKPLLIESMIWSSEMQNVFRIPPDSGRKEWNSNVLSVLAAENGYKRIQNGGTEVRRVFSCNRKWGMSTIEEFNRQRLTELTPKRLQTFTLYQEGGLCLRASHDNHQRISELSEQGLWPFRILLMRQSKALYLVL